MRRREERASTRRDASSETKTFSSRVERFSTRRRRQTARARSWSGVVGVIVSRAAPPGARARAASPRGSRSLVARRRFAAMRAAAPLPARRSRPPASRISRAGVPRPESPPPSRPPARRSRPTRATPSSSADPDPASSPSPSPRSVAFEYLGGNGWRLAFPRTGATILCDRGSWATRRSGTSRSSRGAGPSRGGGGGGGGASSSAETSFAAELAEACDVLLLSQGWDDPRARARPSAIPARTSPSSPPERRRGGRRRLGFERVVDLRADAEIVRPVPGVAVRAVAGALVGPPWSEREAGFIVTEHFGDDAEKKTKTPRSPRPRPVSVYYEPHCSHDASSVRRGVRGLPGRRADVAVVPVDSVRAAGFPLVNGGEATAELLELLGFPEVVVPLKNGRLEQAGAAAPIVAASVGGARELPGRMERRGWGGERPGGGRRGGRGGDDSTRRRSRSVTTPRTFPRDQ